VTVSLYATLGVLVRISMPARLSFSSTIRRCRSPRPRSTVCFVAAILSILRQGSSAVSLCTAAENLVSSAWFLSSMAWPNMGEAAAAATDA
jgi:hypothetical protein